MPNFTLHTITKLSNIPASWTGGCWYWQGASHRLGRRAPSQVELEAFVQLPPFRKSVVMAEIIGAVAAAAQLSAACLSLIDFTKRIKGASSTLRKYHEQLQELRSLSDNISRNPLLQTGEVESHTRNLLSILSQNNLGPLLRKGRFLRTLYFLHQDRAISNLFSDLEKQKATLSLIINDIQSRALHQIQADIKTMAGNNPSRNYDSGCEAESHAGGSDTEKTIPKRSPSAALAPPRYEAGTSHPSQAQHPSSETDSAPWRKYPDLAQIEAFDELAKKQGWYDTNAGIWFDCNAGDGVDQINGTWIRGSDELAEKFAKTTPTNRPRFIRCTKSGRGGQTNGLELEYSKASTGDGTIDPKAIYDGAFYAKCDFNPDVTQDTRDQLGVQVQGVNLVPPGMSSSVGHSSKSKEIQHNGGKSRAKRVNTKK